MIRRFLIAMIGAAALHAEFASPMAELGMQKGIEQYARIAKQGGWPTVVSPYFTLERGDWSRCVTALRAHLIMTGDLASYAVAGDPNRFDARLVEGVKNFQERHGLPPSGKVNRDVLEALNVPVEQRIRQLKNSLERRRHFQFVRPGPYVLINLPATRLEVIDGRRTVVGLKTIVGRKTRPSPIVASAITTAVFLPTWTVPTTIMTEDMPRKVRRFPHYFEDHNMSVFRRDGNMTIRIDPRSVDWNNTAPQEMLRYTFVQGPGPENALGLVKFLFANPFGVYLHDTESPELFAETFRFFSSGCIRVQSPQTLVDLFFGRGYKKPTTPAAARPLPRPVPIFTVYWTSWADGKGRLHFRKDIYSKDATCDEGRLGGCVPVPGWQNLISPKQLAQARAVSPAAPAVGKPNNPAQAVTIKHEELF